MKAHDLAKALLDGPNVEVMFSDDESAYVNHVTGVDPTGQFCECEDFPEDDSDEEPPWDDVVVLTNTSTDGALKANTIF